MNDTEMVRNDVTTLFFCLLAAISSSCNQGKDAELMAEPVAEVIPPALDPGSAEEYGQAGEGRFMARQVNTPLLSSILPGFENVLLKKIVIEDTITDADTLTLESPPDLTRREMIEFYAKCFREQGFEVRAVDAKTVHFARIPGYDFGQAKEPRRQRRRTVLPPRADIGTPTDRSPTDYDMIHVSKFQASVVKVLLPEYGDLVGKRALADESVDEGATMTIGSQWAMERKEAIKFFEDSFKLNGYGLEQVDENTVRISKGKK